MVNFNSDFGAGFIGGLITGVALIRLWQRFQRLREANQQSYRRMTRGNQALRVIDRRYVNHFIKMAQANHLVGDRVRLTEVLVEPRFIRAPELIRKPDDEQEATTNVFQVVPQIHDYPFLHAPYNIPTLSIEDLGSGERNIALLGLPGSGRTTALLTIGLWALRMVDFAARRPDADETDAEGNFLDEAAQMFEENEGAATGQLPTAQRAERVRNRARARMSQAVRVRSRRGDGDDDQFIVPSFRDYAPLYVHLGDVDLSRFGRRIDPAEPLVDALQRDLGSVARKTTPRSVYRLLARNQALVLIDGYDDLPQAEREQKMAWIQAFVSTYGDNFIIIAAPPNGYQPLNAVGVAPVYLRPWSDQQLDQLTRGWAQQWPQIAGEAQPPDGLVARLRFDSRALPAFDAALKARSMFSGGSTSRGDWIKEYLQERIEQYEGWLPLLKRAASVQLDEGYITRSRLINLEVEDPLGVPSRRRSRQTDTDIATADAAEAISNAGRRRIASEQGRFLRMLQRKNLLLSFSAGRYQFRHPFIAAYLAGLWLADRDSTTLVDRMQQAGWQKGIAYAGQHIPLDLAVQHRLSDTSDILQTNLLTITGWLTYLESDTAWRGNLLRYLGTLFVAPNQWSLMRERIAAALVSARDPGAMLIFQRGLQSPIPDVARVACLGLGVLRDESAVEKLAELVASGSPAVQLAATMALGVIGTDDALEQLGTALLTSNNNDVQRAAAETLAADRENGYPTLYEAVGEEQDISIRRAAVFGLGRIATDWALIKVDQVAFGEEDEEYYVKSAAEEVLQNLFGEEKQGALAYPAPTAVPWLLEWAQGEIERGNIPHDIAGVPLLLHALEQTESAEIRELAAATAGQLGVFAATAGIYDIIIDPNEHTRDRAHRALAELQTKMGANLPRPA